MKPGVRVLVHDDELLAAATVFRTALVGLPPLPHGADLPRLFEPGRTLGAFVDGELAGTADSYSGWLVVPGGKRVPHAAVTHVGVLPTHTRRGIVTELLRHQLADLARRGEVVATLRASEAVIYERFGYGVASSFARRELSRRDARLRDTVPGGGRVRLVDATASWKLLTRIYESGEVFRAGAIHRPDHWWRLQELRRGGETGPSYVAVHGPADAEEGFVRYHPIDTAEWFTSRERTIVVDDLVATTPEAYTGLIRHLLAVDLVDRIVFPHTALDDPLAALLTDERAVRTVSVSDETWLRILDVPAALDGRTYRSAPAVVLAVTDDLLPENTGSYLITAEGAARTDAPPTCRWTSQPSARSTSGARAGGSTSAPVG